MKCLLDVNALVALAHSQHAHHARASAWYIAARAKAGELGTCSITELGFVRVSVQSGMQADVATARLALARLKTSGPLKFATWTDPLGADALPGFVKKPAQIIDGHLLALAKFHGAKLVTLDSGIPGADFIP